MNFSVEKSIALLERTPATVKALLQGIPEDWIHCNEGENTWNPYDIIGHYIHGEKTDWVPRMELILSGNPDKHFVPFDRFAQYNDSKGKTLTELLVEFGRLREKNIDIVRSKNLSENDLVKKGIHPKFGEVTLAQLLSTWVVHDLNHIAQISRVMAKHYAEDVGPWTEYLRILQW
ncbi:MAG TPA: DinB family protein [Chitinophagaceae bacterium]|nr:DinB family protein [Chitinophagaceae bacterium]